MVNTPHSPKVYTVFFFVFESLFASFSSPFHHIFPSLQTSFPLFRFLLFPFLFIFWFIRSLKLVFFIFILLFSIRVVGLLESESHIFDPESDRSRYTKHRLCRNASNHFGVSFPPRFVAIWATNGALQPFCNVGNFFLFERRMKVENLKNVRSLIVIKYF